MADRIVSLDRTIAFPSLWNSQKTISPLPQNEDLLDYPYIVQVRFLQTWPIAFMLDRTGAFLNLWDSQKFEDHHCQKMRISSTTLTLSRLGFCRHGRSHCFSLDRTVAFPKFGDSQTFQDHHCNKIGIYSTTLTLLRLGFCKHDRSYCFARPHDRISEFVEFEKQDHHCHKMRIASTTLTLFKLGFCRRGRSHFCSTAQAQFRRYVIRKNLRITTAIK